jgi:formate-dependent nitrite reductase membrane component NrfD
LIVLIGKGAAHILFLGRPSRFWRIFFRPQTSWISRGLIFMVIFVVFGALYLAPDLGFDWLPWSSTSTTGIVLWIVAAFASLCMMIYDGFLLMSGRSIPAWHNGIIPLLFAIYSLDSGIALTSTLSALSGRIETVAEAAYTDMLVLLAVLASLGVYLLSMAGASPAARLSLRNLLRGGVAPFFIGGTIIAGVVVPLILIYLASSILYLEVALSLIAVAGILALLGDLFVRHSILKVGYHTSPI